MAKKDLGSTLSAQPTGVKIAMLVGVLAVMGFVYWQFFYSGLREDRDGAISKNKSLLKKADELKQQQAEYDDLIHKKKELDTLNDKGLRMLPAKSELPAFLKNLQNQAGAAGVKLKTYEQSAEIVIDKYVKVPYKIVANGTFYQLNQYFWLLWKSSQTGRIITIENLHLYDAKPGTDGIELTAEFTASTFRQADVEAAPPEPAKGKGKDDKASKDDKGKPGKKPDATNAGEGGGAK